MGNTVIQCLYPSVAGRLFEEDFETPDWVTDQRWIISWGNPVSSPTEAYIGVKSFAVDDSGPLITRAVGTAFKLLVCYFFDDTTETGSTQTPFILADSRTDFATAFGMGVDNGTSTTHYSVYLDGALSASAVARSDGWHRIKIVQTGASIEVFVDDVSLGSAAASSSTMDLVRIGNTTDVDDDGWVYIDGVQVMLDTTLKILGDNGRVVTLYDNDGVLDDTQTIAAGVASFDLTASDMPYKGSFRATGTDGVTPYFVSEPLSLWNGDEFTLSVIDFERKVPAFSSPPMVKREDNDANSGRSEGVFFNARDIVRFVIPLLTDDQMRDLYAWWGIAQQRMAYGVAIDSDDTIWAPLLTAAAGGDSTINIASSAGIGVGSKYLIRRLDNLHGEHIEVTAIAVNGGGGYDLTLDTPLKMSYRVGDYIRSLYYWPRILCDSKEMPISSTDPKVKRWSFTHQGREQL